MPHKMASSILAICCGACLGALARWFLNEALNSIYPAIPLGTLAVNLAGGLLMGMALELFSAYPALGPEWRLAAITGFLGSLTTFSAFSAEMSALLMQGRFGLCAMAICLHVCGSICMVFLGLGAFKALKNLIAG